MRCGWDHGPTARYHGQSKERSSPHEEEGVCQPFTGRRLSQPETETETIAGALAGGLGFLGVWNRRPGLLVGALFRRSARHCALRWARPCGASKAAFGDKTQKCLMENGRNGRLRWDPNGGRPRIGGGASSG